MQPENEHKQLIVIDFEYAAANLPGFEFANHFTEWAYNYHDATASHACNTHLYPTPEEQQRFLKAYVEHRAKFHPSTNGALPDQEDVAPSATALASPSGGQTPSSSIVEFMLDARVPPGGWKEQERRATELSEHKIRELAREAKLWRAMNSAQWVAWGIVQAKIDGFSDNEAPVPATAGGGGGGSSRGDDNAAEGATPRPPASPASSEGTVRAEDEQQDEGAAAQRAGGSSSSNDEEEGFDYLSYAHDRALFFWGDVVRMGLIQLEELPAGLRERVKMVEY